MKTILRLFILLLFIQNGFSQSIDSVSRGTFIPLAENFAGLNGNNTIRKGLSWMDTCILNTLPMMMPGNMRYPAGSTANWWNWQSGWFLKEKDLAMV